MNGAFFTFHFTSESPAMSNVPHVRDGLSKAPSGIEGLDDITGGGLPRGRSTLLCGGTGTGKTLMAMEFLVHGAVLYGEPGVFITFEESEQDLRDNIASFGFDLDGLIGQHQLMIDCVLLEPIAVSGTYDLDGLFVRLEQAIKQVDAKRVVLDSVDMLFSTLPNRLLVREELRRLLRWLKLRGLTVIITAESDNGNLTRDSVEEYVSDCVIALENRVTRQASVRLLRIVKYRGSAHGGNEYPFLIGEKGISVLPVTSLSLDLVVSQERVSTGIPRLDTMLDGKGYYRGSSIMVSGPAGSGKSSVAAKFAQATCNRGERCLYFLLEESRDQVVRNMRSIGIDLQPFVDCGLLRFMMTRPTLYGLEAHLARFHQAINEFKPSAVVFDPITILHVIEDRQANQSMLMRLVNYLRLQQITAHFVTLTAQGAILSPSEVGISSLIDSWIQLRDVESNGERNRVLLILKSRGMPHSRQLREFVMSSHGIDLVDIYTGSAGVLTGSARILQEMQEASDVRAIRNEIERRTIELASKRQLKDTRIAAIEAEFAASQAVEERLVELNKQRELYEVRASQKMFQSRQSDLDVAPDAPGNNKDKKDNEALP